MVAEEARAQWLNLDRQNINIVDAFRLYRVRYISPNSLKGTIGWLYLNISPWPGHEEANAICRAPIDESQDCNTIIGSRFSESQLWSSHKTICTYIVAWINILATDSPSRRLYLCMITYIISFLITILSVMSFTVWSWLIREHKVPQKIQRFVRT